MFAKRIATLCAAAVAMVSVNAGTANAQGLFGNYTTSYPVYTAPSTTVWPSGVTNAGYAQPCATGQCPRPATGYTTNYGVSPCATGNCPTSPYVSSYPVLNSGASASQCRTICGPNGCQQVCPTGYSSPCGPNGCPPAAGLNGYVAPTASVVPSLNLDQSPAWNGNTGFNGANYPMPNRPAPRQPYAAPVGQFNQGVFQNDFNIQNDPMVRLN